MKIISKKKKPTRSASGLMAEFIGGKRSEQNGFWIFPFPPDECTKTQIYLRFHTHWNWLMEVWYKFRDLKMPHKLVGRHKEYKEYVSNSIINGTIETSYKKLAEAIEWYNEVKSKP